MEEEEAQGAMIGMTGDMEEVEVVVVVAGEGQSAACHRVILCAVNVNLPCCHVSTSLLSIEKSMTMGAGMMTTAAEEVDTETGMIDMMTETGAMTDTTTEEEGTIGTMMTVAVRQHLYSCTSCHELT